MFSCVDILRLQALQRVPWTVRCFLSCKEKSGLDDDNNDDSTTLPREVLEPGVG